MKPAASVASILQSAVQAIIPLSGHEMLARIEKVVTLARQTTGYRAFREAVYERKADVFCRITCDSRETVPLTLALFVLAGGDLERCVTYAANLGRDADTIASMCGAIAGALGGVDHIRKDWVAKAQALSTIDQRDLAVRLARTARAKYQQETESRALFESISGMR